MASDGSKHPSASHADVVQKKKSPDLSLSKCLHNLQSSNSATLHIALTQIRCKYIKDNAACSWVVTKGILPKLFSLVSNPKVTSKVLDLTLSILGNLATASEVRSKMISSDAVELIGAVLMQSSDPSIQNRACRSLANLAHDPLASCAIHLKTGLLKHIVSLLKETESKENAQTLVRSLRVLANNRVHLLGVLQTSCVNVILNMMSSTSASTITSALNCLTHLTSIYNGDRQLHKDCDTRHDSSGQAEIKEMTEDDKREATQEIEKKEPLDEAADALAKPNKISLSRCCDELTRQLVYCEAGLQLLIETAQRDNPALRKLARTILFTLTKQTALRTQLSNAGFIPFLIQSIKENRLQPTETDSMRLLNSLAVCSQEASCRAKIRQHGGLDLILTLLDQEAWQKMHCRLICALVCYIYDSEGLETLLGLKLCQRLMPHLLASADLSQEETVVTNIPRNTDYKYSLDSPTYQEISSQQESVSYDSDAPTNIWDSAALESDSSRAYSPMSAVSYHSPEWGGAGSSGSPSPARSISPALCISPLPGASSSPASPFSDFSPGASPVHMHSPSYNSFSPSAMPDSPARSLSPLRDEAWVRQTTRKKFNVDPLPNKVPHRRTQHNILVLLSRISYLPDPTPHLICPQVMRSLLRYIAHSRRPLSRATRIIQRLVSFPICFEALIATATPFAIATMLGGEEKLRESLLTDLSITMATAYGSGTMEHMLLTAETKTNAAISLPFICRGDRDRDRPLLTTALDILFDLVFRSDHPQSLRTATEALAGLASCYAKHDMTQIPQDLTQLQAEDPTEIEFLLDDGSHVKVEREILSQKSEVFRAMLMGNYTESTQSTVRLPQVLTAPFKELMNLTCKSSPLTDSIIERYSRNAESARDFCLEMLALSNRYILTEEQQHIAAYISQRFISGASSVSVSGFSSILLFALTHNSHSLVSACFTWLFTAAETEIRVDVVQGWQSTGQCCSDEIEKSLREFLNTVMQAPRLT